MSQDKYSGYVASVVGQFRLTARAPTLQFQSRFFPTRWPVTQPAQKGALFQRNNQWYYTVRPGESPAFIALRATGSSSRWPEFLAANRMSVNLPPLNGDPNAAFSQTRSYTLAWPAHWPKELRYA